MKKVLGILLICVLLISNMNQIEASAYGKNEISVYLDEISRHELEHVTNPTYGSMGGEWLVMGLARYGTITDDFISVYKSNLKNKLKSCGGILSERKYTEYSRVIMALTAIEENPENFCGYNLLKPLAELDKVSAQGANGILYALLALDCGEYSIPEPDKDYKGEKTTREKLINMILKSQLNNGGWNLMGKEADADITAIAVQALAPYYNKEEKVKKAIEAGLEVLSSLQQKDGGYKTGSLENCESTSQVLTAMAVLNIDINDARFVKNGNTVVDGLMKYYGNGYFRHMAGGDENQMATEQATYALVAYYRSLSGMNGLFKMKDGITKRNLPNVKSDDSMQKDNGTPDKKTGKINKKKTDKKNAINKEVPTTHENSKKNKLENRKKDVSKIEETQIGGEKNIQSESGYKEIQENIKSDKREAATQSEEALLTEENEDLNSASDSEGHNFKREYLFIIVICVVAIAYIIYKIGTKKKVENK